MDARWLSLTEFDSVRNLTFPNPPAIDLPDLYRSYNDYLQISYDLVRSGVRFGNNNWTPIRARSFADPVERIISTTSDQLTALYNRGLFAVGEVHSSRRDGAANRKAKSDGAHQPADGTCGSPHR